VHKVALDGGIPWTLGIQPQIGLPGIVERHSGEHFTQFCGRAHGRTVEIGEPALQTFVQRFMVDPHFIKDFHEFAPKTRLVVVIQAPKL